MNSKDQLRLHEQIRARDGALCVYAEKQWIAHAKMSIAALSDTSLHLRFSALSTAGFTPPEADWEAGVALSEFRFHPEYWMGSPYLAWIIAFAPEALSSLIAVAHGMQDRPADQRALALRAELARFMWPEFTNGEG